MEADVLNVLLIQDAAGTVYFDSFLSVLVPRSLVLFTLQTGSQIITSVLLLLFCAGVEAITWDSACPDQTMPDVLLTWQLVNVLTMTGVEAIWIAVAV